MTAWRHPRTDGQWKLTFGGGINERDDFNVSLQECTEGRNFIIDQKALTLKPRAPQDLEGTAPNTGEITGIMQLIKRDDTVTQVIVADDTWYDWNGASNFTDVTPPLFTSGSSGSRMRSVVWSLDDILVITNIDLNTPLYKWDGATASRLKTTLTSGTTQSVTNLTCTGSLATATVTSHGYSTGDLVTIAGANETEYNGEKQITVSDVNTFTYTHACSTTPATGTITSDKGPELKAKYAVVHQHRVWLFNIQANGVQTPNMILASAFEDAEDYDNANRGGSGVAANDAFFILSPDGRPINAAVSFYDTLIISTEEGKLFKLIGSDATDYEFTEYYPGSSAQGDEGMANTGDDIIYFKRGQVVESLVATQKFGDVATDDLSTWIPNLIKDIVAPIVIYDQERQRVYFFCSNAKGCLVFDKTFYLSGKSDEFGKLSPWSFYTTLMSNEWATKCAVQLRDPLATDKGKTVFWGDDSGNIYNMNGTGTAGDGGTESINLYRKSRIIENLSTDDEITIGRLEYRRNKEVTCELTFNWSDEYSKTTASLNLKESFGLGGAFFYGGDWYWGQSDIYWGSGSVSDDLISSLGFSVPGRGTSFFVEISVSNVGSYTISGITL